MQKYRMLTVILMVVVIFLGFVKDKNKIQECKEKIRKVHILVNRCICVSDVTR